MEGNWRYVVLVAAFVSEFLFGGFSYTIGIYLVAWQDDFDVGAGAISVIASEFGVISNFACRYIYQPVQCN